MSKWIMAANKEKATKTTDQTQHMHRECKRDVCSLVSVLWTSLVCTVFVLSGAGLVSAGCLCDCLRPCVDTKGRAPTMFVVDCPASGASASVEGSVSIPNRDPYTSTRGRITSIRTTGRQKKWRS